MLKRLQRYLTYGKYYVGIEHNEENIRVSVLKISKSEINTHKQATYSNSKDLVKSIPKQYPVVLIINSQHVLTKVVASNNTSDTRIALKAFPIVNLEEFYIEVLQQGSQSFVSICRKSFVDKLIEEYIKENISIIQFRLGNVSASILKDFIKATTFYSSNAKFTTNNSNYITQISPKKLETPYQYYINGLQTSSSYLLSVAGALQTALDRASDVVLNTEGKNTQLRSNFTTTRLITQTLRYGGILVLITLLINFFIFNQYYNKTHALEQTASINNAAKDQLLQFKAEIDRKKSMVDDVLRSQGSSASLYVNDVLKLLPNTMLLKTFNYQPLQKRIKKDKPIELHSRIIEVAGETASSQSFSLWIAEIEQLNWVNSVSILDFGASSNQKEVFKIKIHLQSE